MATGPTGFLFKKDGVFVDFYNVFQPGNDNIVTGYKSGSTDLGNLFMKGDSGIVTGYKSDGTDLGNLFINTLPFTTTGATTLVTTSITNSNYCYAIFTGTGTVIPKTRLGTLYIICVGGGGAGGWARSGISCGGGGGGGVDYNTPLLSTIDTTLTVSVGQGGIATQSVPSNGGTSNLSYTSGTSSVSVSVTGGTGGTSDARGNGGTYINSSGATIINGGNGGDRENGFNWGQVENPSVPGQLINIPVPTALTGIITSAYSGGGAGGKGDGESTVVGGCGGGNGLGGIRASSTYTEYVGQDGVAYGGGGGGGGWLGGSSGTPYIGGDGANGVVIVYSLVSTSIESLNLQSYNELYRNNCTATNTLSTNVGISVVNDTFQAFANQYGTINPGYSLLNKTILVDMNTSGLCNLFFGNNTSGAGFMIRLDGRLGSQSGIATTTSWTVWNAPTGTGINLLSNVWYTFVISIDSSGNISWAAQQFGTNSFVNNTIYSSLNTGVNTTVSSSNTFLAVNGDRLSSSISNFKNIIIYNSATL